MIKVILFDFDGTIADSFENFLEIVDTLTIKYNLQKLSRNELEKLRLEEPKAIIKKLKIPIYKIPFIARDMKKLQGERIGTLKPIKGLPEALKTLKERGYSLGIATSNSKVNVQAFLEKNNLELFDYMYTDAGLFGKSRLLKRFLKKEHTLKNDVLYIGDEIRDIQACRKVGIKITAVTWGFNLKEALLRNDPDFIIDKTEDLLEIVKTN